MRLEMFKVEDEYFGVLKKSCSGVSLAKNSLRFSIAMKKSRGFVEAMKPYCILESLILNTIVTYV